VYLVIGLIQHPTFSTGSTLTHCEWFLCRISLLSDRSEQILTTSFQIIALFGDSVLLYFIYNLRLSFLRKLLIILKKNILTEQQQDQCQTLLVTDICLRQNEGLCFSTTANHCVHCVLLLSFIKVFGIFSLPSSHGYIAIFH
jgi:hypothetical protein